MYSNVGQAILFIEMYSADIIAHVDKDIYIKMIIVSLLINQTFGNILKTH